MKRLLALSLGATLAAVGCIPAYPMQPSVAALMVASAVPEQGERAEPPPPETHIVYVYGPPPMDDGEPVVMPNVAAPYPPHRVFDQAAARASLHAIDVNGCADRGASQNYVHALVTFDTTGRAVEVVIDEPTGLAQDAVACLGDAIGKASAPAFDGSPVTVGTSFYVK